MSDVIRFPLCAEQARLIPPLVLEAAKNHQNVIFFAVTLPFWSAQEEAVFWELQITTISARLGQKIRKMVLAE